MVNERDQGVTFLTLTFRPQGDWTANWKAASKMWATFHRYLKRKLPRTLKGCPYVWVLEPHKSGHVHLHAIYCTRFLHKNLVQKLWRKAGGGHSRVSPKPEDQGVSPGRYVSKYIAKFGAASEVLLEFLTVCRVRSWNMAHVPGARKKPTPDPEFIWLFVSWWQSTSIEERLIAEGWKAG